MWLYETSPVLLCPTVEEKNTVWVRGTHLQHQQENINYAWFVHYYSQQGQNSRKDRLNLALHETFWRFAAVYWGSGNWLKWPNIFLYSETPIWKVLASTYTYNLKFDGLSIEFYGSYFEVHTDSANVTFCVRVILQRRADVKKAGLQERHCSENRTWMTLRQPASHCSLTRTSRFLKINSQGQHNVC